jgi:hypothetical protein
MIQPLIKNKLAITSPIRKLIRIDTLLYQVLLFNNNLIKTISVVKNKLEDNTYTDFTYRNIFRDFANPSMGLIWDRPNLFRSKGFFED